MAQQTVDRSEYVWMRARQEARNITQAGYPTGPVTIRDLVRIAGIWDTQVHIVALDSHDEDVAGFVIKHPNQPPNVYINEADTNRQQRFTLAHLIGHIVERHNVTERYREYSFRESRPPPAVTATNTN